MDINLTAETEKALKELASANGQNSSEFAASLLEEQIKMRLFSAKDGQREEDDPEALARTITRMMARTPEERKQAQEQTMQSCKPRHQIPANKTLFDMVAGKWPGDETDEEVNQALERLS